MRVGDTLRHKSKLQGLGGLTAEPERAGAWLGVALRSVRLCPRPHVSRWGAQTGGLGVGALLPAEGPCVPLISRGPETNQRLFAHFIIRKTGIIGCPLWDVRSQCI